MADRAEIIRENELPPARSTGEIVRNIARDFEDMVRGELRLARAELAEKGQRAASAAGLLGGAAVGGLLAAACLVLTCIALLDYVLPLWASALIMAGLVGSIAGICFVVARQRLKRIHAVPERTVRSIKDSAEWANQRMS